MKRSRPRPGCILSFTPGFPPADIADCGPAVFGYGADQATVERAVDRLADAVNAAEPQFAAQRVQPVAEAVANAIRIAATASKPVVLADTQDNPGAGAPSNTTGIIAELLAQGAQGAVGRHLPRSGSRRPRTRPASARISTRRSAAGLPAPARAAPRTLDGGRAERRRVRGHLADAALEDRPDGQDRGAASRTASRCWSRASASSRSTARPSRISASIPRTRKIVALKSSVHFRAGFQPIAEEVITCASPGMNLADPADFSYRKLRPRRPAPARQAEASALGLLLLAALAARLPRLCSRGIALRDRIGRRNVRRGLLGRGTTSPSVAACWVGSGAVAWAAAARPPPRPGALCSSICRASAAAASAASCIVCAAAARSASRLASRASLASRGDPPRLRLGLPRPLGREPRGLQRGGAARLLAAATRFAASSTRRASSAALRAATSACHCACRSLGLAPRAVAIARDLLAAASSRKCIDQNTICAAARPEPPAGPDQLVGREQPPAVVAVEDRARDHLARHRGGVQPVAAERARQPIAGRELADLRHLVHRIGHHAGPRVLDLDLAELRIDLAACRGASRP